MSKQPIPRCDHSPFAMCQACVIEVTRRRHEEGKAERDAEHAKVEAIRLSYKPMSRITPDTRVDGYAKRTRSIRPMVRGPKDPWLDPMGEAHDVEELRFE